MKNYRYTLEMYKGRDSRYSCPACNKERALTLYIDNSSNEHLHREVGKCNREDKCGYHLTPKEYFENNGIVPEETEWIPQPKKEPEPIIHINTALMQKSLTAYDNNNFVKYLVSFFGKDTASILVSKYFIGSSKYWNNSGACIFWQIDRSGLIRTGKVMLYNPDTGKRIKEPFNHIQWVHKLTKEPGELKQCFFGEHLLKTSSQHVAVVESEKTAIIASAYFPDFVWLACGGLSMLNYEKCKALIGRNVILFPDLNGFHKWKEKADLLLPKITRSYSISSLLESVANKEEKSKGLDLADYLLRYSIKGFATNKAIQINSPTETNPIPANPKEQLVSLLNELIQKVPIGECFAINDHKGDCFNQYIQTALNNLVHTPDNPKTKIQLENIYLVMQWSGHEHEQFINT